MFSVCVACGVYCVELVYEKHDTELVVLSRYPPCVVFLHACQRAAQEFTLWCVFPTRSAILARNQVRGFPDDHQRVVRGEQGPVGVWGYIYGWV